MTKEEPTLAVNEIYGPVLQGEGPNLGAPTLFLRLQGCNLACTWCDTPYTWDASRYDMRAETHKMSISQVSAKLHQLGSGLWGLGRLRLDISGGEPMLQQDAIEALLNDHRWHPVLVDIETAGTIPFIGLDPSRFSTINVSPKLEHSGNEERKRRKIDVLRQMARTHIARFKFVVQEVSDLNEVLDVTQLAGIHGSHVYIMPEGTDRDTILQRTAKLEPEVLRRGWNMTTRLHVLLHGDERRQ